MVDPPRSMQKYFQKNSSATEISKKSTGKKDAEIRNLLDDKDSVNKIDEVSLDFQNGSLGWSEPLEQMEKIENLKAEIKQKFTSLDYNSQKIKKLRQQLEMT